MNMYDRTSHWPIYDVVPLELIKIVAKTVKEAPVETVESKDGLVVYFPKKEINKGGNYDRNNVENG